MSERETIENFVNTTLKSDISDSATQIETDTASSPYNSIPDPANVAFLVLMDNADSPTKWEVVKYTARTSITGGFRADSVTRNIDSSTGSAQSFDAGSVVRQAALDNNLTEQDLAANSGSVPEVDRTNTFSAAQSFSAAQTIMAHKQESETVNLADDATHEFTTIGLDGNFNLFAISSPQQGTAAALLFYAANGANVQCGIGSNVSIGTNSNPDVDGNLNTWINTTNDTLNVKNRLGGTRDVYAVRIGRA